MEEAFRVRVKICGLTRQEDARLAVELGTSALGFIFYPRSPRYISPEEAREIIAQLPPLVTTVGVFVNEPPESVWEVVSRTGIDLVQLHGEESPEYCELFFPRVIKALRLKSAEDLEKIPAYQGKVRAILLDTYVRDIPGGTGQSFNWSWAREAKRYGLPIILAGGLHPGNIKEALKEVQPYGIDLSSGVESSPGRKDPEKLRALFRELASILQEPSSF